MWTALRVVAKAMIMSQRYPLYFDGIVAGAPAMRTGYSSLAMRTVTVALNAIAPKDANGRPRQALSDGDKKAVIAKLLELCDAHDGVADGMIFDVTGCTFCPRDLECVGAKGGRVLVSGAGDRYREGVCCFEGFAQSAGLSRQVYPGRF